MEPQPEHELEAGLPQTSQWWLGSAFKGRRGNAAAAGAAAAGEEKGGEADDEQFFEGADAADEAPPSIAAADAAREGEGEEGDNAGDVPRVKEVDDPNAALDGFPPFFFVMAWCEGVLDVSMSSSRG